MDEEQRHAVLPREREDWNGMAGRQYLRESDKKLDRPSITIYTMCDGRQQTSHDERRARGDGRLVMAIACIE